MPLSCPISIFFFSLSVVLRHLFLFKLKDPHFFPDSLSAFLLHLLSPSPFPPPGPAEGRVLHDLAASHMQTRALAPRSIFASRKLPPREGGRRKRLGERKKLWPLPAFSSRGAHYGRKKGTHFERDKEGGGNVELTCLHAVFKLLVMERMEEDGPAGGER